MTGCCEQHQRCHDALTVRTIDPGMPLNARQQRFVEEFCVDLNATQAAIRAGYSRNTAGSQGQRLLTNAEIQRAVEAAQREHSHATGVTVERLIREMAALAFSDVAALLDEAGNLRPVSDWPAAVRPAIRKIRVRREAPKEDGAQSCEVIELAFWDKTKAQDMLAKHLGLYAADNRQLGEASLAERVRRARNRVGDDDA